MPFGSVFARLVFLAPLALAACVEGMPADPKAPRMEQAGTCFAYVTPEAGGQFALVTGKGDGTRTPMGQKTPPMTAAAVDAAFAHEVKVMGIMPECLAVYAKPRAAAPPAAPAAAPAAIKPAAAKPAPQA
jgi:hypothetical protein